MKNFEKGSAGAFPAIITPAKEAVKKMFSEGLSFCAVEGKPGFFVAPLGTVAEESIYFRFEFEGAQYVIFDQD